MAAPGPESGPLGVIYDVSLCFTSHPPTSSGFHFRFFGDSPSLSIPSCFVASAVPSVSRATHASQAGWASPETSLLLLPPPLHPPRQESLLPALPLWSQPLPAVFSPIPALNSASGLWGSWLSVGSIVLCTA